MRNKRLCRFILIILLMNIFLSTSCSKEMNENLSMSIVKNNVYLEKENIGGLRETEVLKRIKDMALKTNIDHRDAKLNEVNWELIEKEQPGRKVNIEKTLNTVLGSKEGDSVKYVVEDVEPQITSEKLLKNIVILSSFSTPVLDKQTSRVNNIVIAAEKLDYKKIGPGEEFSFNKILGKRTEQKGYEYAPIIVRTEDGFKKGYGIGGGICQVATTLYNAVEKSEMEITERHLHSKNVGYVSHGKDATVSYGSVDFKFVNNRSHTIMIRAFASNSSLTIKLLENRN